MTPNAKIKSQQWSKHWHQERCTCRESEPDVVCDECFAELVRYNRPWQRLCRDLKGFRHVDDDGTIRRVYSLPAGRQMQAIRKPKRLPRFWVYDPKDRTLWKIATWEDGLPFPRRWSRTEKSTAESAYETEATQ